MTGFEPQISCDGIDCVVALTQPFSVSRDKLEFALGLKETMSVEAV